MNNTPRRIKIIKHDNRPAKTQAEKDAEFMKEHELGMLHLLVRKYPEKTKELAEKVCCKPHSVVV